MGQHWPHNTACPQWPHNIACPQWQHKNACPHSCLGCDLVTMRHGTIQMVLLSPTWGLFKINWVPATLQHCSIMKGYTCQSQWSSATLQHNEKTSQTQWSFEITHFEKIMQCQDCFLCTTEEDRAIFQQQQKACISALGYYVAICWLEAGTGL